jgi:hypothetical protein
MSAKADVLLVGSVPLSSNEIVMRTCGRTLEDSVIGLPDGETGDRTIWVVYQAYRVFHEHPQIQTLRRPAPIDGAEQWIPQGLDDLWSFRVAPGVDGLRFDDLKYASVALDSYAVFQRLRAEGSIADGVRFQVCLPFPESGVSWFFQDPSELEKVIPPYREAMRGELARILDAIPHSDLAIQWDVCWEVLDIEGIFPWAMTGPPDPRDRYIATVSEMSRAIPEEVLVGYHLCYADLGHRHMKEPQDLRLCVEMANLAAEHSGRRVDFVHMPVPRARDDEAYFEPLDALEIGEGKVFLGLIHHTDGLDGSRRRLAAAQRHLRSFGLSTECGFGRRPPEQVEPLLALHRELAAELRSAPR